MVMLSRKRQIVAFSSKCKIRESFRRTHKKTEKSKLGTTARCKGRRLGRGLVVPQSNKFEPFHVL